MRKIYRNIVAAVLFSLDGKVLIGRKDPNEKMYVGKWGIPGGGVEEGETLTIALQREIAEETGIDITGFPVDLIDDVNGDTSEKRLKQTGEVVLCEMKFNTYKVQLDKKANEIPLAASDDLVECRWVTKDGLKDVELNGPTIWLFTKMGLLIK